MRVAVLGAGVSGLTSMRACVQHGFHIVCFEKTNDIGGLWKYKPQDCQGEASVMRSTVINTSKEMMAFSDFPPPDTYPNFMHNTYVYAYLKMYAEHFDVLKYIKFQTEVLSVDRNKDYEDSGQWDVTYRDASNNEATETFDAVFLCSGHHVFPHIAEFEGLKDKFKGKVLHSHDYKDHKNFEDKTVVVVGIGNSGGDIATELSRVAKKDNLTAAAEIFAQYKLNSRFNHENYGLKPEHGVFQAHLTINDDLPNRILCGTVVIKPQIQQFMEDSVVFEDGTAVENVDTVILCTGYSFGFPYVEKNTLIAVKENAVSLYKYMYPPHLTHPTLCVVGLVQPWGAIMPISELQARVACGLLDKVVKFPTKPVMEIDIMLKKNQMATTYAKSRRHTIQVDYIPYMDELAIWLGVKPDLSGLFLRDPRLALSLVFGPCAPYQFRLQGRHKWEGARNACLTVGDRLMKPLQTRICKKECKKKAVWTVGMALVMLWLIWYMIL